MKHRPPVQGRVGRIREWVAGSIRWAWRGLFSESADQTTFSSSHPVVTSGAVTDRLSFRMNSAKSATGEQSADIPLEAAEVIADSHQRLESGTLFQCLEPVVRAGAIVGALVCEKNDFGDSQGTQYAIVLYDRASLARCSEPEWANH